MDNTIFVKSKTDIKNSKKIMEVKKMKKNNLKVGQKVFFRPTRYTDEITHAVITNIGRKYFYTLKDGYMEQKVSIEEMRVYRHNYGWQENVYTSEQAIADEDKHNALVSKIRELFSHFGSHKKKLTLNQLRNIWKIINGDEITPCENMNCSHYSEDYPGNCFYDVDCEDRKKCVSKINGGQNDG